MVKKWQQPQNWVLLKKTQLSFNQANIQAILPKNEVVFSSSLMIAGKTLWIV